MGTDLDRIFALFCVFLHHRTLHLAQAEKHSLYYIYTVLSRPVDLPGIYEFTVVGLLDDTQIDYFNSTEKKKIPKQQWMKEKLQEDYWEKGTRSRKSKEQWFNVNVQTLMDRMKGNESDLHVLQWRVGCEVELQGDEVKFLKGIDEYGYDGEDFVSFNTKESQWVAPVEEALPTKRKWDNVPILTQHANGYLEQEYVDWLNKFRDYADEELRNSFPPKVHVFAKRFITYKTKLKLTCMATGFYPKDVMLAIMKNHTPVSEDEIESLGIRPNHDGSFQIRKSVEIKEGDERAEYDCFVSHRTLKEPIIIKWDGKCWDCPSETPTGAVIVYVMLLAVVGFVVFILMKKAIGGRECAGEISDVSTTSCQEALNPLQLQQNMYASVHALHMGHLLQLHLQQNTHASVHAPDTGHLQLPFQIPEENMVSVPVHLLQILDDLDSHNLKRFKWYLKERSSIPASLLESADNTDVVDKMVECFGPNRALKVTVEILRLQQQNHLAEKLIKNYNKGFFETHFTLFEM